MAVYRCKGCDYLYDESIEKIRWAELPDDWFCPVCGAPKSYFEKVEEPSGLSPAEGGIGKSTGSFTDRYRRTADDIEECMVDIHAMAETGQSVIEPMRTKKYTIGWDEVLFNGAQLAQLPLNENEPVKTTTVIGPRAKHPLEISMPIYISHMSYGALSEEVKIAMARGSAAVKTLICSGEGGILPEEFESAYKYIFEYIPNRYSVTDENLKKVDAIEIKIGQSAKPGMGGFLPGVKVTEKIAKIRGFKAGEDITSPARYEDITNSADLKKKIDWLREKSDGRPIGVKIAAGNIEADLEVILPAGPDFITIDGRAGGTGAAPKHIKAATSVPTLFALYRARKFLDDHNAKEISLIATGGFRVASDMAKALAMGANAVAIATAALIACGCQQYRVCHTGKCPVGITTQDPELRARFDIEEASQRMQNYLTVCNDELKQFARLTGKDNVHLLSVDDLCTTNSEISNYTDIRHV